MEDFVLTRDEESEQVISFFPIFALALNFFSRIFFISSIVVVETRKKIIGNPQTCISQLHNKKEEKKECFKCASPTDVKAIDCGHYFCLACTKEQGCEYCGMLASVNDEQFIEHIEKEIKARKELIKWENDFEMHQKKCEVCLECKQHICGTSDTESGHQHKPYDLHNVVEVLNSNKLDLYSKIKEYREKVLRR